MADLVSEYIPDKTRVIIYSRERGGCPKSRKIEGYRVSISVNLEKKQVNYIALHPPYSIGSTRLYVLDCKENTFANDTIFGCSEYVIDTVRGTKVFRASANISILGYDREKIAMLYIKTISAEYTMKGLSCVNHKYESIKNGCNYTKEYINSLSFREYLELMAKELNDNGFKSYYGSEYTVSDDPILFMMQPIEDPEAMRFLTWKGLIGNGRCPQCGAPMSNNNHIWYDRRDPSRRFNVCYGCSISNGHGDGHSMDGTPSGDPSNRSNGCMSVILLFPFFIVKAMLGF
ncbi:MAG: hypothetical protein IKK36_05450 [Bacteroidales bacterium]|nr:hypothetical protein [Bacteroidales bacterium]